MHRSISVIPVIALAAAGFAGCSSSSSTPGGVSKIYVAEEDSGSVAVIDTRSNRVLQDIALDETMNGTKMMFMPHNVQVAPDGKSVWVTAPPMEPKPGDPEPNEEIVIIDPSTDAIANRIVLGAGLHLAHVVLDAESRFAYVSANAANKVFQIDATSRAVTKTFDLGAGHKPHGMRVCGDRVFVANMDGKSMSILDPSAGAIQDVPLGGVAVQIACTSDGKFAFASLYDTREVIRFERASGTVMRIALPADAQGPVQLYPMPDNLRLFVCDQGVLLNRPASNRLFEIDIATAAVTATIQVGNGAHGVVVSDDGAWAYVTNTKDNTLSVVDTKARRVQATIPVGGAPNGVSHLHAGGGMP